MGYSSSFWMMSRRLWLHFSMIMHGKSSLSLTRSTIPIIIGWLNALKQPISRLAASYFLAVIKFIANLIFESFACIDFSVNFRLDLEDNCLPSFFLNKLWRFKVVVIRASWSGGTFKISMSLLVLGNMSFLTCLMLVTSYFFSSSILIYFIIEF